MHTFPVALTQTIYLKKATFKLLVLAAYCDTAIQIQFTEKPYLNHYLAVVLKDVSGSSEVQHPIDDQLTVSSKLVASLLEDCYLPLLLTLN